MDKDTVIAFATLIGLVALIVKFPGLIYWLFIGFLFYLFVKRI